ncbi:MAG: hypothetical protein QOJ46_1606, partial [bacterium]
GWAARHASAQSAARERGSMQRSSGLPGAALRTAPAAGRIVSARASERLPIAEDHSCVRAARFYPSHVGPARSARLISAERFRARSQAPGFPTTSPASCDRHARASDRPTTRGTPDRRPLRTRAGSSSGRRRHLTSSTPTVWTWTRGAQAGSAMSQFSMRSSGMRAKCRTLPVTSVASRASAIAAMRRSGSATRCPVRSSSARSCP